MSEGVAQKEKRKTGRYLFLERLKREGREHEWYDRLRRVQEETGKQFNAASVQVMKELGYISREDEQEKEDRRLASLHKEAAQVEFEQKREEFVATVHAADFEDAVAKLPDTCPAQVELDWIRNHPAMFRKSRSTQKMKDILLTVEDVLSPPHGCAPSKGAVIALQHWCNQPTEFFKQLLGEQKKQTEAAGHTGQKFGGDDISEVERLLQEIGGGSVASETEGVGRSEPSIDMLPGQDDGAHGGEANAERMANENGAGTSPLAA